MNVPKLTYVAKASILNGQLERLFIMFGARFLYIRLDYHSTKFISLGAEIAAEAGRVGDYERGMAASDSV